MPKKIKSESSHKSNGNAGEYYKKNCKKPIRAKLLVQLNSKTWQARNLDTNAKIKIEDKDLHDKPYHEGWTRISAQEALGPNWGKVEVSPEAEEMFGVLNMAVSQ